MSGAPTNADGSFAAAHLSYGLNLPKKKPAANTAHGGARKPTLAAFACDSEDDEDDGGVNGGANDAAAQRARANKEVKRQQEALLAKQRRDTEAEAARAAALNQDASAFEYDAVFDDIQKSRGQKVKALDEERVERKSRYIGDLIAKAEARKVESDISYERRLLKERLKDDHLYADKEKFVTAAYREKLKEDAKWLAKDKVKDAIEEEEDVARRGDMTAFYSNLMNRNSAMGGDMAKDTRRAAPEPESTSKVSSEGMVEKSQFTSAAEREREFAERAKANQGDARDEPIPTDVTFIERQTKRSETNVDSKSPAVETAPISKQPDPLARRNTDDAVSDARQRYLERKRKAASSGQ